GAAAPVLLRLGRIAHAALEQSERGIEARAQESALWLAAPRRSLAPDFAEHGRRRGEDALHEQPAADAAAGALREGALETAAALIAASRDAADAEPGAAALLDRLAAVLLARAGQPAGARAALERARATAPAGPAHAE